MKISISKAWCLHMAKLEGGSEVGAGTLEALHSNDEPQATQLMSYLDPAHIAFGRLIRLLRRKANLTIERLADETSVDLEELVSIEDDIHYSPDPRTVYQLANFFKLPRANLLQLAGLTTAKNGEIYEEAIRFAARSDTNAKLTREEQTALEAFVSVLGKNK